MISQNCDVFGRAGQGMMECLWSDGRRWRKGQTVQALSLLPEGSCVVNVARGPIIVADDLLAQIVGKLQMIESGETPGGLVDPALGY